MFSLAIIHLLRTVFQTPDWWRRVLPGGALNLVPTVLLGLLLAGIIPLAAGLGLLAASMGLFFIAWGYLFRIFVDALNGSPVFVLPDWDDLKGNSLAGFWLFLIALGYGFLAVVGLSALFSVLGILPGTESPERLGLASVILMVVLVFFYGFFPIVFTRFAAEGHIWAAFEPLPVWRDLRRVAGGPYIQACLGLFALSLLGNLVLGLIPFVGVILAANFWFLLLAVFARLFGLMIRASRTSPPPFGDSE